MATLVRCILLCCRSAVDPHLLVTRVAKCLRAETEDKIYTITR